MGPDNTIIIWDGITTDTVRTIFDPHPGGVKNMAFTEDAKFIASLGCELEDQALAIWNWTDGRENPMVISKINPLNLIHTEIAFKPDNYFLLSTNSDSEVRFYEWEDGTKKRIARFSHTSLLPGPIRAITATNQGSVVIWEDLTNTKHAACISKLKAKKTVTLHDSPITFLTVTRCFPTNYCIVTGDANGVVKFFDLNCMLLQWYSNFNYGPIRSISFAERGTWPPIHEGFDWRFHLRPQFLDYPHCATIGHEKFIVDDFSVSTTEGRLFTFNVRTKQTKILNIDHVENVTSISTHPSLPHLVTCGTTGLVKIFDYNQKICIAWKTFTSDNPISICRHNKAGNLLAVGFRDGTLRMLDSITLDDTTEEKPFDVARGQISQIDFDSQDKFCAHDDAAFTTTLLQYKHDPFGSSLDQNWHYLARVRAHHRPITSLLFWTVKGTNNTRLFTVGEDRIIADYDVQNAKQNCLTLLRRLCIEILPYPLCLARPPSGCYAADHLIMSTSNYKLKVFDPLTLMFYFTAGAFPEGIEFKRMVALPRSQLASSELFLLSLSDERLTLSMGPFDGDPLKSTNILAHPNPPRGVALGSDLTVSNDGRLAFTAGGPDKCVHVWGINPLVLEERVAIAVEARYRFYALMDHRLLEDMKDYCYYVMLRTQGLSSLMTRETSLTIPLEEIPNIMRAVGYYPTETEINNMINEVKHTDFVATGEYASGVDLDKLIQMYCNYRSCAGFQQEVLDKAIKALAHNVDEDLAEDGQSTRSADDNDGYIETKKLLSIIQEIGDKFSESELIDHLALLLGQIVEGGRPELTAPIESEAELVKSIHTSLPDKVDGKLFASQLLNMKVCGDGDEDETLQSSSTEADSADKLATRNANIEDDVNDVASSKSMQTE